MQGDSMQSNFTWDARWSVADPGFHRVGGANSKGGCEKLLFSQFFQKTAWNWKNLDPKGAYYWRPLRSANGDEYYKYYE